MAPYLTLIYRATGLELLSSIAGEKPTEEKGIAKRNLKVAILILSFELKYETAFLDLEIENNEFKTLAEKMDDWRCATCHHFNYSAHVLFDGRMK